MEQHPGQFPPHPVLGKYYRDFSDRERFVTRLFDRTATDYEWINSVASFGSGVWYRRKTLCEAGLLKGMKVLDVACGTGVLSRCATQIVGPSGMVVGLDASAGMLHEIRPKTCDYKLQGKAEVLPFRDKSFDFLAMGYALRHVSDLRSIFIEYFRVLKPGGILLILELSRPQAAVPYYVTRFYLKTIVPWVARLGTGNIEARTLMQYCWDTIDKCAPPGAILESIVGAGFVRPALSEMFGGILRHFIAVKPRCLEDNGGGN